MALVNRKERKRIQQAVAQAESRTRGEFVTVIAKSADDYFFVPVLWAALLALLLPAPIVLLEIALAPLSLYLAQLIVFTGAAVVLLLPPLRYRLVPGFLKRQRARRLAREQFVAQGVHVTRERAGVLLFVSEAEHYVEILADAGINAKVAPDAWQQIVDDFLAAVRDSRTADGLVGAIDACGALLATHFPADAQDKNELPDRLVEI